MDLFHISKNIFGQRYTLRLELGLGLGLCLMLVFIIIGVIVAGANVVHSPYVLYICLSCIVT